MNAGNRLRVLLLILVGLVHLFVSLYAVIPGYLSVDEPTFHMMVKNLSESRGLEIWNGYREYPSPELASASIVAHNGRLVGIPPYLHPLLGVPFYRIWGFRGLFLMNSMAFVGVLILCFALAKKLFDDLSLALSACLILVLATFAWEYSQAAWTHMTALLFNLGAFFLCLLSTQAVRNGPATALALASGLVAGFGVGIRIDLIFVLACLVLISIFVRSGRRWQTLVFLAGAAPGLAVLSATNHAKFGVHSPFSTGLGGSDFVAEIGRYLPFLITLAVLVLGAWILHRLGLLQRLRTSRRAAVAVLCLLVLAILAIPVARAVLWKQIVGTYTLVVDLRLLPPDVEERAMLRSPGGGILYIGGLKKSLLQSCPYLVMLALPALALLRKVKDYQKLGLLFLIPLAFIGFYSQFSWHGGLSLNLRYFTAVLPYTSILSAYALRELSPLFDKRWRTAATIGGTLLFIGFFLRGWFIRSPEAAEFFFLTLPLVVAGTFLILILLAHQREDKRLSLSGPIGVVCVLAMLWSGLVAFLYDYPLAQRTRHYNLKTGLETANLVAPDSIFFANSLDRFFALIESDRVRIARPSVDSFNDLPLLVDFHLAADRQVYAAFQPHVWKVLRNGPLSRFEVTPIWSPLGFALAEITVGSDSTSASQSE